MHLLNSFLFALEKSWVAPFFFVCVNLDGKFKENRNFCIFAFILYVVDGVLYDMYLPNAYYSASALLIYILINVFSILILIKYKHKNLYLLLLIITILEVFSFVARILMS